MKKTVCILSLFLILALRALGIQIDYTLMAPHPRLLMKAGEEKMVSQSVNRNEAWKHKQELLLDECDKMLQEKPVAYQKQGIRLLSPGTAIHRIFFLSYAYRITGDERYAHRAIQEMETVCRFKGWNPSHFLDTATMTMAVGIGYDWLHEIITPQQRKLFVDGIVKHGLLPSKDRRYDGFTRRTNNWNQVCNAGILFGAMAVYDEYPELARELIDRAVNTIRLSMTVYAPEGVYPEGYSYWGYGTNHNVLMIAALESALGTDADLPKMKGFMESAHFINYMVGSSEKTFNYGDSEERPNSFASLYWFAGREKNSGLLWNEKVLAQQDNAETIFRHDSFLPFSLICTKNLKNGNIDHPKDKCWIGHGETPVMIVRTSWKEKEGCYLALKGSKAWMSHGHMDAGSFVFDALGERWASDLGGQSYYLLEQAGVSLWSYNQTGDRWKVFKYNNTAHNTLSIKGELHRVSGLVDFEETLTKGKELGAVMNMKPLYDDRIKEALRKIVLVKKRELLIDDKVTTGSQPVTFEWVLCTPAQAKVIDASTWELIKNGKKVKMVVNAPDGFKIRLKDNTPIHDYDQPNPGTRRVIVEATVPAATTAHITVRLIPQRHKS